MHLTLSGVLTGTLIAGVWSAQARAEAAPEFIPQAPSTNSVRGTDTTKHELAFRRLILVYDSATQAGLAGAKVLDRVTGSFTTTSSSGHVALVPGFVKAGGALLEISKEGFATEGPFLVDPTVGAILEVPMAKLADRPRAAMLPSVVTTAKFNLAEDRGGWNTFDARCSVPHVSCFKREELLKHATYGLADLLVRAPDGGVEEHCGRRGLSTCTVTVGHCTPRYFVDGRAWTPIPHGKGPLAEIEEGFGIANLKGVEIYRPELTPIGFITNDNALCPAAINFWTNN